MNIDTILSEVQDKKDNRSTTSYKFKKDIIDFFSPLKLKNCIEVGTANGDTTRILSYLFDNITTIELNENEINKARELNKDRVNIEYLHGNAYESDWGLDKKYDIAFIDCVHQYDFVKHDFENCVSLGAQYFIFDDYGLNETLPSVKAFVDEYIENNILENITFIGETKGTKLWEKYGRDDALVDFEGIICKKI